MKTHRKRTLNSMGVSDTRNAVETAIDLSKKDKSSRWENLVALGQIKPWRVKRSTKARPKDLPNP